MKNKQHPPWGIWTIKLAGETAVRELHKCFYIVRTSWVYGHQGSNFVKTMLKLSKTKNQLKVVADQIGSPTYAEDLARTIVELINTEHYGTYHVSNSGSCSWYEFAKKIFELAGQEVSVHQCTTTEFPRPAQRPAYSVFEHRALKENGFKPMRSWQEALATYFEVEKRRHSPE
ncbi:sugar nucleotide-binding protein [Bacillus sp. JCM 19041]|uniref:SDR family oxidoreductase n=1 Tax=Bacillus sp. JCM 19041 TaxID=1460637 RepID=UPI003369BDAC